MDRDKERLRGVLKEEVRRWNNPEPGRKRHPPSTLHSSMTIAARHFVAAGLSVDDALEVLAEESGVPLVEVPGHPGLSTWEPAQGETWLGWQRNGWAAPS